MKKCFVCWVLLLAGSASATTRYVDGSLVAETPPVTHTHTYNPAAAVGSRSAGGTDLGYSTVQAAHDETEAGDTVYLRGASGSFNGYYYNSSTAEAAPVLTVSRSGTAGSPITYEEYNDEVVTLSGRNFLNATYVIVDLGAGTTFTQVVIKWGDGADDTYATNYTVQGSDSTSAGTFVTLSTVVGGDGGTDTISFAAATYRYVKINMTLRADTTVPHVYAIKEVEVTNGGGNLALNKAVLVYSEYSPTPGSMAVDGDEATKWRAYCRHAYVVILGTIPSKTVSPSGSGVQYLTFRGFTITDQATGGVLVCGPQNLTAQAENPTDTVIFDHMIFRDGDGKNGAGGGLLSFGYVQNCSATYCEAYGNSGTGIRWFTLDKTLFMNSPLTEISGPHNCTISNCLSYNNFGTGDGGDSDGFALRQAYLCTISDCVAFNNSDDGFDIYASLACTVTNNISFYQNSLGNNAGFKYSAGGGGAHTLVGNIAFVNKGWSFEGAPPSDYRLPGSVYFPSKLINCVAYDGAAGLRFGGTGYMTTWPGFATMYVRNCLVWGHPAGRDIDLPAAGMEDSDYNFIGDATDFAAMQALGYDLNSHSGTPNLFNPTGVVSVPPVDGAWPAGIDTIEEKLTYVRNQVYANFTPTSAADLINHGVVVTGVHNAIAGDGSLRDWYGSAPDIGGVETGTGGGTIPDQAAGPTPADDAIDQENSLTLSWSMATGAITYHVYLRVQGAGSWTDMGTTGGLAMASGTLVDATIYEWRVDTINGTNTTTGATWTFTTKTPVPAAQKATLVFPADAATNQLTSLTLSWTAGVGAVTHLIYLEAGDATPDVQLGTEQAGTTIASGTLLENTTYYWRVDEKNSELVTTTGDVWSFTTTAPVGPVTTPGITNGRSKVVPLATLSWDAVAGAASYNVYLVYDSSEIIELEDLLVNTSATSYTLPTGVYNRHCYWRVDVVSGVDGSIKKGPVWHFYTRGKWLMMRN